MAQAQTAAARSLVARMYGGDTLHIPEFCLLECTNVLWKQVRFHGLPPINAEQITQELLRLPFQVESVSHLLPNALEIGLTYQLAVYDSLYIALAQYLGLPLITVDDRQSVAATASCVVVKPVDDFSTG
ncbi:type II toxin-antitoxin system VapC family toxin [Scytonema sp. PCC 10023]|uniref:type II toxin-antitoxin system VapC family toxin n=1 Tax=Scytonema sp. PCC 10023 TaxID=1680591 RepID=UPI0039C740E4